ncbi:MAG: ATP-binding protein, partial [Planctomycetota bacterium]
LARLRMLLVLSWVGASILCAAGLAWVVRRGLGPLADLGDQIQAKDETDLGTPFDLPRAAEELEPVIERLNGFRERVGDAIDREHAFAAHAAHELRTPLAGLRSTLEVSLSRERDAAEHRESEQASLEITLQLERLVARLLELSRAASPNTNVDVEAIPLRPLVMESWTPYSDAAADRGVFLESGAEEGWTVHTDRQLFGRVLQNLLENASNYADDGTAVRLEAEEDRGAWTVRVSNRTTGLDAETTRHAFDAFWRSDSAHSAVGRHAGLGLSLCRDVMNRLGGAIEVDGEDDVFRATLRLPPRSAGGARADRSE